ncbi:MAG: choice-of-anchor A family protein, partial [Akkermansiaceae bacterium]|nr:choice-of-anchor A family protein [Armatimonadota bacterium]
MSRSASPCQSQATVRPLSPQTQRLDARLRHKNAFGQHRLPHHGAFAVQLLAAALLLLCGLTFATGRVLARPSTASSSNLGVANDYNVFVFESGTLETGGSTIEGRLAVGGLVKTKNYSIGQSVPSADAQVPYNIVFGGAGNTTATTFSGTFYGSLVSSAATTTISVPDVRGNVHVLKSLDLGGNNGWGGTVQGNAFYGTTFRKDANVTVNGQTQQGRPIALPFSFAQTESNVRNLSTRLKGLATTGTTVAQYGGITLTGAAAGLNVFDVSAASLNNCNSFTVNVPSGATVLINVTGSGSPSLQNFGITLNGTGAGKVLWHFPDATNVGFGTSGGIEVKGSVLAPNAAVNFGNGQIAGTLISKSLVATGLFKHVPFTGNLDGAPAATTLLSLSVAPASVVGGQTNAAGTVTLSGAAPVGGTVVNLGSNSAAGKVPDGATYGLTGSVTVPAGATSATFPVSTSVVTMSTPVTISASYGGVGKSAPLTVNPPPVTVLSLALSPANVLGGKAASAVVTLSAPAPPGGAVVPLSSANTAVATVPASVTIPAGTMQSAAVTVNTVPVASTASVLLTASYNNSSASATLSVTPPSLDSVSVSPASVKGGKDDAAGTVTLSGKAPTGGLVVSLSSSVTGAATVPNSVTVSAGSTSATFTAASKSVSGDTDVTISATLAAVTKTAPLRVLTPALVSVNVTPASVVGREPAQGKATIDAPAPTGGLTVLLSSSSTKARVPADVTIPAGTTESDPFTVTTVAVATDTTATITGTLSGVSKAEKLTIEAPKLVSVTLDPASVIGGVSSTGTVTLSSAAPAGGLSVMLSSGSDKATVPAEGTVAAGATSATFSVTTVPVAATTTATVTGTLNGVEKSAALTITAVPVTIATLSLDPESVVGGYPAQGTVALSAPAPAGGQIVTLFSSLADVAKLSASPEPTIVTVPAGQTSVAFPITTVRIATEKQTIIKAVFGVANDANAAGLTKTLTVLPIHLTSLSVSPPVVPSDPPDSVPGGTPAKGAVTLSYPAPPGGLVVELASDDTTVATTPVNVLVPSGQTTAAFNVPTSVVAMDAIVEFTATLPGDPVETATDLLTVRASDISLVLLVVTPGAVPGGESAIATATISSPAPLGGVTVSLVSNSDKATPEAASIRITQGQTSGGATVKTVPVAADTIATLTGTLGGTSKTAALTVLAPVLESVSLNPPIVQGGKPTTGTVTLSGEAPAGGLTVTLSSSQPTKAKLPTPASVTVPGGETVVVFLVQTVPVASETQATITGTLRGTSKSASLTIRPPTLLSVAVKPDSVKSGAGATGTVTLSGNAPAGGLTVLLSSDKPSVTFPDGKSVAVAGGAKSTDFAVSTGDVTATQVATITGTLDAASKEAKLSVRPAGISEDGTLLLRLTITP